MAKHYTTTFNTRQNMLKQNLEIFYYEDTVIAASKSM